MGRVYLCVCVNPLTEFDEVNYPAPPPMLISLDVSHVVRLVAQKLRK